ncbi:class I SAM-dependent methyltransferase [Streptococcus sp. X16XC17]|uniref:class I SAM-dependent methyltransferase n=1 Tax=unclassified Streptococcus TaxID=2608887 RepID=UPI00066FE847|nr:MULTISPECIES: class I SAM-dependent methyltransferase [unclassified Streptococcus]TCD45526.1 class I SAM-dependent methyltransferase [Streptococcus sp. X16XC17]
MTNVDAYRQMLAQPWGKIQYEITFSQLAHLENKEILDFGAGFGLVSQFLSQKNKVIAVEPNADMLFADDLQTFTKLHGSLDVLESFADQTFDVICCHNVMEYIKPQERQTYFEQFLRLLKPNGQLSIIKHNPVGKVLQAVVFSNDTELAQDLLDGKEFHSQSFAQGNTYSMEDLIQWSQMSLENYLAIRTFYSLQPNEFKTEEDWLEKMTKIELAVADQEPYKDISFLQHIWLRKK